MRHIYDIVSATNFTYLFSIWNTKSNLNMFLKLALLGLAVWGWFVVSGIAK